MADSIDSLQIEVNASAKKANAQIDTLISKLSTLKSSLESVDSKGSVNFGTTFTKASSGMNVSTSSAKKLSAGIKNLTNSFKNASGNSKSFAHSIGTFYANCFLAIRGIKALGKAMEKGMDYVETYNYYSVTMDKIGSEFGKNFEQYGYDSAEAYADSFSGRLNELTTKMSGYAVGDDGTLTKTTGKNLSLDPEQLMSYQANISAVTNSLGLAGETSINTSKALTMLASDMSSFKNVDLSTVMTNFQSGLIGQSRALYKYGIDITNATLQTYAYKNGVEKSVSEMTQAEKMQLRLLAILDQSKVAWGDQANTISSVANQYRIMKQQVSNLARIIGNLLLPIVQKALPVINGMMIALQSVLEVLGVKIFGDNWLSGIMDGISSGYSGDDSLEGIDEDAQDTADSLADANEKAKKFKNTLLGFDEMNVLNDNSDDSDTSSGIGSSGKSPEIDLSGAIADAVADYESVWNKALQNSQNKAQEWADKIGKVFKNLQQLIGDGEWDRLGAYVAGGINKIVDAVDERFNWDYLGGKVSKTVNGFTKTLNSLVKNVDFYKIGKTLGDGLNVITNTMYRLDTEMDWIQIGKKFSDGANGLVESIDWNELGKAIGAKAMKLPKIVAGFVGKLDFSKLGQSVATGLNGIADEIDLGLIGTTIGKAITGSFDFSINFAREFNWKALGENIANGINGVLKNIDGKKFAKAVNGFLNGILTTMETVIKEVDWGEVVKGIGDFIGNLDWWAVGKAMMIVGIGKFALNSVSALQTAFNNKIGSFNIAGVINGIKNAFSNGSADISAGTGMLGKLGTAFEGLASSGALLAGVPLAISGIIIAVADYQNSPKFSDAQKEDIQSAKNFADSCQDAKEQAEDLVKQIKKGFPDVEVKYDGIQVLSDKYFELAENSHRSVAEQQEMETVKKMLSEKMPEIDSILGNTTLSYQNQKQAVEDLIGKTEEYYMTQAAEEKLVEVYKQKVDAQIALNNATDEYNSQMETLKSAYDEFINNQLSQYGDMTKETAEQQWTFNQWLNDGADGLEYNATMMYQSQQAMESAQGTIDALQPSIDGLNKVILDNNGTLETTSGLVQNLDNVVGDVDFSNIVAESSSAIDGMHGIWVDGQQLLGTDAVQLYEECKNKLDPLNGYCYTLANGSVVQMGKGFEDGKQDFVSTVASVQEAGAGEIESFHQRYKETGGFIIGGLNEGINNNKDLFSGTMSSLFSFGLGAFNTTAGIHSPSKMMAESGGYIVDGLNNGISDNQGSVLGTMSSLPGSMLKSIGDLSLTYRLQGAIIVNSMRSGMEAAWSQSAKVFAGLSSRISSAVGDLWSVGHNAMQSFANGMSSVHIPTPHFSVGSTPFRSGGANFTLPSIGVNYYAKGGMPNTGELFMARENGINEMVGRMGNQSTVANNDQITQGISDAVAPSVYEAVVSALRTMGGISGNNGDVVVQIDGKEVFRAVKKVNNNEVMSTGQPQFLT